MKLRAFTFIGAALPVLPAMIAWIRSHESPDSLVTRSTEDLGSDLFRIGRYATLVTVPVAALWAGVESPWIALAATGFGFCGGYLMSEFFLLFSIDGLQPLLPLWFAGSMAGFTTLLIEFLRLRPWTWFDST